MSDDDPRPTDRWLPYLAVALLVESATGFTPWILAAAPARPGYWEMPPEVFQISAMLAGVLGIFGVVDRLRKGAGLKVLFVSSVCVLAAALLADAIGLFLHRGGSGSLPVQYYYYLHAPAAVLAGLGVPLVWGAAIARRDRPEDPRLAKLGRIGAWMGLSGFLLAFLMEVPGILMSFRWVSSQNVGLYPLLALLNVAARVLFLWSSIDMIRSAPDPAVCRLRMRRVHRLMCGWAGVVAASSLLYFILSLTVPQFAGQPVPNLWRYSVRLTIFLFAAFATARWARSLPGREGAAA